ncbi:GNAT family N-acetyltransferase [Aestuariirhabdus sp. Z084]|uniref:GNAT family N-acetyltransferase n=1 Tax=Aestuariirhabdus haliotis TaxID=2918751 RepID=UPI00201B3626|nr:GNAT family N-acetyltransferase [Aestuariirhabdus haliotis]MCL6416615.1 GNAT family N-acetyltransferase [Aestuariirhabdus haliotis]MCL6420650.1 GNAT family N-acetyltransferase [Aestuariirhabdus haliotis]
MLIRKIFLEDLPEVSELCLDAFMGSVATTVSDEGIHTFRDIASIDSFEKRMNEDNEILIFQQGQTIQGVIELKEGRHIAMLFVKPDAQRQGVGRALMEAIRPMTRTQELTVSASLSSVSAYACFGFQCAGGVAESAGLKYQPMILNLTDSKY